MKRKFFVPATIASLWSALAGFALWPTTGLSQNQAERPQFDAASIRISQASDRPSTQYDAARVELHKASIKHLVRRAWPLPAYQVVWPAWVGERNPLAYDVSVTYPSDTTADHLQLMFQDLLAGRFGLKMHWEWRDVRAFEVEATERGPRLHEAANPAQPTDYPKYSTRIERGVWHLSSQLGGAPSGLTVAGFLEAINSMHILDRPLVDATGIQGYYDIDLTAPVEVADNKPAASELLGALDKQMGLKASLRTLSLRMLVIDHLERIPTEN
jgi:uncharacterized protein (TIGR03435 family)